MHFEQIYTAPALQHRLQQQAEAPELDVPSSCPGQVLRSSPLQRHTQTRLSMIFLKQPAGQPLLALELLLGYHDRDGATWPWWHEIHRFFHQGFHLANIPSQQCLVIQYRNLAEPRSKRNRIPQGSLAQRTRLSWLPVIPD